MRINALEVLSRTYSQWIEMVDTEVKKWKASQNGTESGKLREVTIGKQILVSKEIIKNLSSKKARIIIAVAC